MLTHAGGGDLPGHTKCGCGFWLSLLPGRTLDCSAQGSRSQHIPRLDRTQGLAVGQRASLGRIEVVLRAQHGPCCPRSIPADGGICVTWPKCLHD